VTGPLWCTEHGPSCSGIACIEPHARACPRARGRACQGSACPHQLLPPVTVFASARAWTTSATRSSSMGSNYSSGSRIWAPWRLKSSARCEWAGLGPEVTPPPGGPWLAAAPGCAMPGWQPGPCSELAAAGHARRCVTGPRAASCAGCQAPPPRQLAPPPGACLPIAAGLHPGRPAKHAHSRGRPPALAGTRSACTPTSPRWRSSSTPWTSRQCRRPCRGRTTASFTVWRWTLLQRAPASWRTGCGRSSDQLQRVRASWQKGCGRSPDPAGRGVGRQLRHRGPRQVREGEEGRRRLDWRLMPRPPVCTIHHCTHAALAAV